MNQSKPDQPTIRLHYLDGLRGIAALYVVLFHAYQEADPDLSGSQFSPVLYWITRWFTNGRFSVAAFIVLSGYCLMLPVVRSSDGKLRGGFWGYLKRRAQRILPPYYAALVLVLLLIAAIPSDLYSRMGSHWGYAMPAFTPGTLLSHFLLVHDLRPDWIYKIDGPMWSVATEWHIYFLFAGLLLPIWRSIGLRAAVTVAVIVGIAPHLLVPGQFDEASPWYLGLFAFGMAGAVLGFSQKPALIRWRKQLPWGKLGVALGLLTVLARYLNSSPAMSGRMLEDFLAGMTIACLLIAWTHHLTAQRQHPSLAIRAMQSQWAAGLGAFSYSLYLVHLPILGVVQLAISFLHLSPAKTLLALMTIGVPLALFGAYGFYLIFERKGGLQKLLALSQSSQ